MNACELTVTAMSIPELNVVSGLNDKIFAQVVACLIFTHTHTVVFDLLVTCTRVIYAQPLKKTNPNLEKLRTDGRSWFSVNSLTKQLPRLINGGSLCFDQSEIKQEAAGWRFTC